MFNTMPSKVKFVDQQLDDYVLENSVLKSKLHSKMEALSIMSKELDKCSMERDRYRLLVQQLRNKHPLVVAVDGRGRSGRGVSGGEMLANTRDHNNQLKLEVETLRARCEEASRDVEALRRQLHLVGDAGHGVSTQHEHLVQQLEQLKVKHEQLQADLGAAFDEKDELAADRDYYKNKVLRLNRQTSSVLAGAEHSLEDSAPAVLMENKYLQERLAQMEVEKEIFKRTLAKHKNVLDKRNKKASLNLNNGNLDVMTEQEVRKFLDKSSRKHTTRKQCLSELKSLCLRLLELLNEKSIALQHQCKTNRILANRISELEKTLESWSNGEKYIPVFPSQMLLEEFCPDSSLAQYQSVSDCEEADSAAKCGARGEGGDSDESGSSERSETVLPPQLQELVREALRQMRSRSAHVHIH